MYIQATRLFRFRFIYWVIRWLKCPLVREGHKIYVSGGTLSFGFVVFITLLFSGL